MVLDEQLLGYGIQEVIRQWYPGKVTDITRLRPGTVILDDAIPVLLRTVRKPTFITINVRDFWRRLQPEPRFGIVCLALPDSRIGEVPGLLRCLFALLAFRSRQDRLGKIVRVSHQRVHYYTVDSRTVKVLFWPKSKR